MHGASTNHKACRTGSIIQQRAESDIDALIAQFDLQTYAGTRFTDRLKEIVRTASANAVEARAEAVGTNDAAAINATNEAKGVFTEQQVSEMLHVTRMTLYNLRESGKLSYVRIGNRIRYRQRDIDGFLESQLRLAKQVDQSNRAGCKCSHPAHGMAP